MQNAIILVQFILPPDDSVLTTSGTRTTHLKSVPLVWEVRCTGWQQ